MSLKLRSISKSYGDTKVLRDISFDLEEGELMVLGPEADLVLGKVIWGAAAAYMCCAAMRLARYNIEVGGVSKRKSFRDVKHYRRRKRWLG